MRPSGGDLDIWKVKNSFNCTLIDIAQVLRKVEPLSTTQLI